MAHTNLSQAIPVVLTAGGTLSAADGWDAVTLPFDGLLWQVQMSLGTIGDTSGNTDAVVERTTAASVTTDLWTIASGCGRIAYNASAKYLQWDWENANMTGYASAQVYPPSGARLNAGDLLKLNIDAIPGGTASTNLKVVLWVKPIAAD